MSDEKLTTYTKPNGTKIKINAHSFAEAKRLGWKTDAELKAQKATEKAA